MPSQSNGIAVQHYKQQLKEVICMLLRGCEQQKLMSIQCQLLRVVVQHYNK